MARWFGSEARRVYAGIGQSAPEWDREWLLNKIRGLGGRVTPRELQNKWRRFKTADAARGALMDLVTADLGKFVLPSEVFVLIEPADVQDDNKEDPADSAEADKTTDGGAAQGVLSTVSPEIRGSVGAMLARGDSHSLGVTTSVEPVAEGADKTPPEQARAYETPCDIAAEGFLSASAVSASLVKAPPIKAGMVEVIL